MMATATHAIISRTFIFFSFVLDDFIVIKKGGHTLVTPLYSPVIRTGSVCVLTLTAPRHMVEAQSMVAGATSAVVVSPTKVVDSSTHVLQEKLHWHNVLNTIAVSDGDMVLEEATDLIPLHTQSHLYSMVCAIPLCDVYIASTEQPLGYICTFHSYPLLL